MMSTRSKVKSGAASLLPKPDFAKAVSQPLSKRQKVQQGRADAPRPPADVPGEMRREEADRPCKKRSAEEMAGAGRDGERWSMCDFAGRLSKFGQTILMHEDCENFVIASPLQLARALYPDATDIDLISKDAVAKARKFLTRQLYMPPPNSETNFSWEAEESKGLQQTVFRFTVPLFH